MHFKFNLILCCFKVIFTLTLTFSLHYNRIQQQLIFGPNCSLLALSTFILSNTFLNVPRVLPRSIPLSQGCQTCSLQTKPGLCSTMLYGSGGSLSSWYFGHGAHCQNAGHGALLTMRQWQGVSGGCINCHGHCSPCCHVQIEPRGRASLTSLP